MTAPPPPVSPTAREVAHASVPCGGGRRIAGDLPHNELCDDVTAAIVRDRAARDAAHEAELGRLRALVTDIEAARESRTRREKGDRDLEPTFTPRTMRLVHGDFTRAKLALTHDLDAALAELGRAVELLRLATTHEGDERDGYSGDELAQGVCGFCGYYVVDCNDGVRDADDDRPHPCRGIDARLLLAEYDHKKRGATR